ncbi:hypothetical protein UFOVP255_57 [uncultured Caudovirales phage]|uniref:Uncharacterized protein n=1 Tax=uncultured Caudovirales phage TaxID=2100421 RepID=A0A6J5LHU5_9CAUD|nr:hypothetical protein UFOVP255_57 [uncultured Caudovirales phage]
MASLSGGIGVQKKALPGYDLASISRKSPQQMDLYNLLFQGSKGGLEKGLGSLSRLAGGDENEFEQMEKPAYTALQRAGSQSASQFSGFGSGARNSSGFQNAIAGQAGDLAEKLQSRRMEIQQQSLSELLGLGRHLLSEDLFENQLVERPEKYGFAKQMALGLSGGIGQGIGSFGGQAAYKKFFG